MQCPGQDTRYWKPDDVFEVPCQACGNAVEFFKTDVSRRCPGCGERLQNPRVSMGCAQWCAYAKQCLGFDPKEVDLVESPEGSLVDRIVKGMRPLLEGDEGPLTHALLVLNRAQEILLEEEANPQVVLAAALLHDIGSPRAGEALGAADPAHQKAEGPPLARQVLEELDLKDDAIDQVCDIVHRLAPRREPRPHSPDGEDTLEFRVVWDADRLVEVPEAILGQSEERLQAIVREVFRTATGQKLALRMAARRRANGDEHGSPAPEEGDRA